MRWFAWGLVSGLVLVAACTLDFTGPPTAQPAVFAVSLVLEDIPPSARFTVGGRLTPGRDANGQLRVVQDSIALIWGTPIEPVADSMTPGWIYDTSWTADPGGISAGALCVQPPSVVGVDVPDDPICTSQTWRAGAGEFAVSRGSELRFELVGPGSSQSTDVTWERWAVQITAGDTFLVTVLANGPPPQTVMIPGDWLAAAPAGDLEAEMLIDGSLTSDSNDYVVHVGVRTTLRWIVTLVD
jgi:hypothetical protein